MLSSSIKCKLTRKVRSQWSSSYLSSPRVRNERYCKTNSTRPLICGLFLNHGSRMRGVHQVEVSCRAVDFCNASFWHKASAAGSVNGRGSYFQLISCRITPQLTSYNFPPVPAINYNDAVSVMIMQTAIVEDVRFSAPSRRRLCFKKRLVSIKTENVVAAAVLALLSTKSRRPRGQKKKVWRGSIFSPRNEPCRAEVEKCNCSTSNARNQNSTILKIILL